MYFFSKLDDKRKQDLALNQCRWQLQDIYMNDNINKLRNGKWERRLTDWPIISWKQYSVFFYVPAQFWFHHWSRRSTFYTFYSLDRGLLSIVNLVMVIIISESLFHLMSSSIFYCYFCINFWSFVQFFLQITLMQGLSSSIFHLQP